MADSNRDRIRALMAAKLKEKKSSSKRAQPARRATSHARKSAEPEFLGKVLIAEDDKRVQTLLANAVKALHLEPVATDNGMEAVMYMQVETPLLIILDQFMPQMTGAEACAKIREMDTGLTVPIMMVTGNSDRAVIQEAVDAGITDFMAKPLNLAQFQERVKKHVKYDELVARKKADESPE